MCHAFTRSGLPGGPGVRGEGIKIRCRVNAHKKTRESPDSPVVLQAIGLADGIDIIEALPRK